MKTDADLNNNWRKVASTIYKKPSDSKIFGWVEIDVTELEEFITRKRQQGLKITMTHIITLAVARAFKQDVKELNAYVRRGKIVSRNSVDAVVSVLINGEQMSSVKVENADQLTLQEIADNISVKIKQSRKGNENKEMKSKEFLSSLPWPIRTWFFHLYRMITINLGLSIPFLNLNANSFGSFVISNIGTLGLDMGIPALLPSSNVSLVLMQGGIFKKPVVVNDRIVPRRILSLGAALDHRIVDASQGGRLFRFIKQIVKNPEILETKP